MLKLFHDPQIRFKLIGHRKVISLPPLIYLSLSFAAGICISFRSQIPFLPLFITTFIGLCFLAGYLSRFWFIPFSIGVFFMLGLLYGTNSHFTEPDHVVSSAPVGRISIEGTVISVPESVKHGRKETISFVLESKNFYRKGTVYQTKGKIQVFLHNAQSQINYGDHLRLKGSLEEPKQASNPYSFDYRSYLSHQGIFKIFRGIGKYSVSLKSKGDQPKWLLWINRFRVDLKNRISALYPSPYSELAVALILGFRKNISDDINNAFIKTGTAHLLAISGQNISLVATLFYILLGLFRVPRTANFLGTFIFIIFYTALAGANIPVLRAGIMGCMVLIGMLLGQERNLKSALFFSFFVLIVLDPSVLFQASFQLSYLAMASLLYLLPPLEGMFLKENSQDDSASLFSEASVLNRCLISLKRSLAQSFLASFSATVGMFPVLLWYFNLFSAIGFLCNLIAIPLCTLAIASTLALLVIDFICSPIAACLSFLPLALFRFELGFIFKLSQIPFGYFYLPRPNFVFFIIYYGLLAISIFMRLKMIQRVSVAVLTLSTFIFLCSSQFLPSCNVIFDLGKTEAFFISFSNGSKCLINAGRRFPNNQAYWIIRPYLMARAVHKLDGILLTGIDGSHAGGFQTILNHVQTNHIFIGAGDKNLVQFHKYIGFYLKEKKISEGDRIQFGSDERIFIEILTCSKGIITSFEVNDRKKKMLYILLADSEVFNSLLNSNRLKYAVIYLPHHNSPMSDAEKSFLSKVSANFIALNQRQKLDETLITLNKLTKAKILSLQNLGAIEFFDSQSGFNYRYFKPVETSASNF